jgi:hypothetical protein
VSFLTHLEHYGSPWPASLLSLYLGLVFLFDIVRARTLWIIQDNRPFAITFSVGVGVHLALFLAINICSDAATIDQKLPRETRAKVYTRRLFWWLNPLFWLAFKTILDVLHLPAIDTDLRSRDFSTKYGYNRRPYLDVHLALYSSFSSARTGLSSSRACNLVWHYLALSLHNRFCLPELFPTLLPLLMLGWRNSWEMALSEPPPSFTSAWPLLMPTLSTRRTGSSPSCEVPWSLSSTPRL